MGNTRKKAREEYQSFAERTIRQQVPTRSIPKTITTPTQLTLSTLSPEDHDLLTEMKRRDIAEKQARVLLANLKPGQNVMTQLQYVDSLLKESPRGKIKNPAGFYIRFIQDNTPIPELFRNVENRQSSAQHEQEKAYQEYCQEEVERYISTEPDKYQAILVRHRQDNGRHFPNMPPGQIETLSHHAAFNEIRESGWVKLPTFEEFCRSRS